TFSLATGAQKLGQPVPDSNLVFELNSALSQQMQRYSPVSCKFQYCPEKANSVSACRVISKALGESCCFHSASDFTTFGTFTVFNFSPASENWTMVTSWGGPSLAALTTCRPVGRFKDHSTTPPIAAAPAIMKPRRVALTGSSFGSNMFILYLSPLDGAARRARSFRHQEFRTTSPAQIESR